MGTDKLSRKPDEMLGVTCDGLASHLGGLAILLQSLNASETGISSACVGHLARVQTLLTFTS